MKKVLSAAVASSADGHRSNVGGTVYLGQFTDEHADDIAAALDEAGIRWHAKSSGAFTRFIFAADWGVRLFVDVDRADDAWALAGEIAPDGLAKRP